MAVFLNPTHDLEDIAHVFEEGARSPGGITLDEVLCGILALGLRTAITGVGNLVAIADAHGLVGSIDELPAERVRTPVERQQLARLAVTLDPGAGVIAFPIQAVRLAGHSEGGSAA